MRRNTLEVVTAENQARFAQDYADAVRPDLPRLPPLQHLPDPQPAAIALLPAGDGGGTSGGMSDDWKASVDQQLTQLHGDVRVLLYGLIAGFLVLAGAGAAAFVNLSGQIADGRKDVTAVQVEQAKSNAKLDILIERTAPGN